MLLKASTLSSIALALSQLAVTNGQLYDEEAGLYAREAEASDSGADYFLEARDAMPDFGEHELIAREFGLDERSKIGGVFKAAENFLGLRDALPEFSEDRLMARHLGLDEKSKIGGVFKAAENFLGLRDALPESRENRFMARDLELDERSKIGGVFKAAENFLGLRDALPESREDRLMARELGLEERSKIGGVFKAAENILGLRDAIKAPSGSSMLRFGGDAVAAGPGYAQMFQQNHKRGLDGREPRVPPGFGRLLSQAMGQQQQQQQMIQRRDLLERDADANADWDTATQLYGRHLSERKIKPPSGSSMLDFGGNVIGAVPQYAQMAQNH